MTRELADPPGIFSIEHLKAHQQEKLKHLRFCRWCHCGMIPKDWEPYAVGEHGLARCPHCEAVSEPLTLSALETLHHRRALQHVFVCSLCGTPFYSQPAGPLAPEYTCLVCQEKTRPMRGDEFLDLREQQRKRT